MTFKLKYFDLAGQEIDTPEIDLGTKSLYRVIIKAKCDYDLDAIQFNMNWCTVGNGVKRGFISWGG